MNRPAAPVRFDPSAPARFSAAEYLRMAELGAFEDMKVELDRGEIIRMTPPHPAHGALVARVIVALANALRDSKYTVTGEASVMFRGETVFGFDAAVVRGEVPDAAYEPEQIVLAIEVAHTSLERDLGRKAGAYAEAGIRLYWVVDLNAKAVHVMSRPGQDGYAERDVVRFGEPLALPDGLGTIQLD